MRPRLVTLLALALPMVLARASQSVITFADALQVKELGPDAIAATATGGLNTMTFVMLPMGLAFIVQSFVAQLVGRGDLDQTRRFAWYGLGFAVIAGGAAALAIPFVAPVLGLASYTPEVHDHMTSYMQIRLLSVAAAVGIEALGNWYGGLGNTWMQMVAGLITMVAAIACNAIFIPYYGVDGAAIGSVIATWLGFLFLLVAFWRSWGGAPKKQGPLGLSKRELWRVARFGLPNGLNWFLEFAAFDAFVNVVVAKLGSVTVAGLNVVIAVNSIAFMPAFGLASAGAILAGQAIGQDRRDQVWANVKLTLVCTIAWEGAMAIAYLVAPTQIIAWFAPATGGAALLALGATMLPISAIWQVFDAIGMTLNETLRAAGDTAWTATARILLAWGVFAPVSYACVRVWHGGAVAAMLCLCGYIALLALILGLRFKSGAWKRIQLIEPKVEELLAEGAGERH
ncbi:MAG TPA: MATE family efflux transporter [Kofleriaceae bacterium]